MIFNPKKKQDEDPSAGESWLVTYSDTVTLLLALFILLFSLSSVNEARWQEFSDALVNAGKASATESEEPSDPGLVLPEEPDQPSDPGLPPGFEINFELVYETVSAYVDTNGLESKIGLEKDDNFVLIRFKDNSLFDSGRANIKTDSLPILEEICKIINLVDDLIEIVRVDGHTDNIPINTTLFPSNWELSGSRAINVAKAMIDRFDVDPAKVIPTAYAEYRPIADNSTAEGRAANRRVEIYITKSYIIQEQLPETPGE